MRACHANEIEGEYDEAERLFRELLDLAIAWKQRPGMETSFRGLAGVKLGRGGLESAAVLYAAAARLRADEEGRLRPFEERWLDGRLEVLRASLASTTFEDAWSRGLAMTLEEAATFARSG